jgi:type II secretory pathway pseudopilin PulG
MSHLFLDFKNFVRVVSKENGMSVTELMVSICILAVIASVGVPFYVSSVQQGRVVSLILPRLHMIEASVSFFYLSNGTLPNSDDIGEVLQDFDAENLDIAISAGSIAMTIRAPDKTSKLHILDGDMLLASPVFSGTGAIAAWHLDGELADRLRINY